MSHFPIFILLAFIFICRERPAAIPIEIKSIDDTSNFDEFPESDILQPGESTIVNSTSPSLTCQNTAQMPLLLFILIFLMPQSS